MQLQLAYLLGLITGRGTIFDSSYLITVEFSHTNEFIDGIAPSPNAGKDDRACFRLMLSSPRLNPSHVTHSCVALDLNASINVTYGASFGI